MTSSPLELPAAAPATAVGGSSPISGRCFRPSGEASWPGFVRPRRPGRTLLFCAHRSRVLVGGVRNQLSGSVVFHGRRGNRQPARGQDAVDGPARLWRHPPALQPGRRALDLLPGEGPRHAGGGADGLAPASTCPSCWRRWCTRRGWWCCWRSRSSRRTASSITAVRSSPSWRSSAIAPVPGAALGDRLGRDPAAGEHLSGPADPRRAEPRGGRRGGRTGAAAAPHAARAAAPVPKASRAWSSSSPRCSRRRARSCPASGRPRSS